MNSKCLIHVLILLLISGNAFCKTIKVPEDKPNLRAAIKKAKSGDVILVSPGIYKGLDNKNLVIERLGVTVRSIEGPFNTIIDGEGAGRCFDIIPMEHDGKAKHAAFTHIRGFTIMNFSVAPAEGGGAVRCQSDVLLGNCIIAKNSAGNGGGIYLSGNKSRIVVDRSTITGNKGGGVFIDTTSELPSEFYATIIWGNFPYDFVSERQSRLDDWIMGCDLKSGRNFNNGGASRNNFEYDPLFADPANGNYRLTSCSPCIDASGLNGKDPDGTAKDVGVYSVPYAPCNPADSIRLYTTIDPRTGDTLNVLTDEDFEKVVSINREGHRSVSIIVRIPAGCVMSSRQLEGLLTSADKVLTPRELSTYANIGLIRLNVTILPAENSDNYYLSDELLKTLAEDRYVNRDDRVIGKLKIFGVNQLTEAQAELLGKIKCNLLRLEHLSVMSDNIAEHLSKAKSWELSLPGVSQLTNNQAVIFSNFESNLFFPGLQNISNEQAKALANFKGKNLWLNGLHDINDEQARAFASYQGDQLYLGVNSLTVEQAK